LGDSCSYTSRTFDLDNHLYGRRTKKKKKAYFSIDVGSVPMYEAVFFIILSGVRLSESLGTAATTGLFHQPQMMIGDGDCGEIRWNEDWQGKPKYSEKTCPGATLSTTNPT
jgi:hypothetical protein